MKCFRLGIILFSFLSVSYLKGQNIDKKYEKAYNYFEKKNYKASIEICNDILNNLKKNNLNSDQIWYCFNAAYLLHYIYNDSTSQSYNLEVSKTYIETSRDLLDALFELKPELKVVLKSKNDYINSYLKGNNVAYNSSAEKTNQVNENTVNENKDDYFLNGSVKLTVSANGNSYEQAVTNALKSSIEQVFGAFITTKTVIANDSLLKDELVSVSAGNVENYNIVSKYKVSDSFYNVTLVATISTKRLLSFVQNKDASASINGNLFVQNIELQRLNEENETKTLKNISYVSKQIIQKSLDFDVSITDPVKDTDVDSLFNIKVRVNTKFNKNIINLSDYLYSNIKKLAMKNEEISSYQKIGKKVYGLIMPPANIFSKKFDKIAELEYVVKNNPGLSCYFRRENQGRNVWVKSDFQVAKIGFKKSTFYFREGYATDNDTLGNNVFYLRNKESLEEVLSILNFLKYSILHFEIENGIEKNKGIQLANESRNYNNNHNVGFNTNFYPFFQNCSDERNIFINHCGNDYNFFRLLNPKYHNELKKDIKPFNFLTSSNLRELNYVYNNSIVFKYFPFIIPLLDTLNNIPEYPLVLINLCSFLPTDINSYIFEMHYSDKFNINSLRKLKQYKIKPIEEPLNIE